MPNHPLNRLKVLLVEKGKTSKELAAYLGKTVSTISRWCTNTDQPSVENLYSISQFLDVDIRDLLISTKK